MLHRLFLAACCCALRRYVVFTALFWLALVGAALAETCEASQYGVGDGYHGKRTASGAIFNTYAKGTPSDPYTVAWPPDRVAHRNGWSARALGSWITITNLANGRSIRAKITDRGPFIRGRCVDLGRSGANAIGMGGTARVSVQ